LNCKVAEALPLPSKKVAGGEFPAFHPQHYTGMDFTPMNLPFLVKPY
jgi:hypothetical protein